MGGLDVILSGHGAQAQPIGDDSLCKVGPYTGKGRNQPKHGEDPTAPSAAALSDDAGLFMNEFEDVALLRQVWRLDDGNDTMSAEERSVSAQISSWRSSGAWQTWNGRVRIMRG